MASNWRNDPATPKQIDAIRRIQANREMDDTLRARLLASVGTMSKGTASDTMAWLDSRPTRGQAAAAPATVTVTETGFYLYENEAYRVQRTKDGQRLYAKKATPEGWDYGAGKGVVFKLAPEMLMTAMEIAQTGATRGFCLVCSTGLQDPISKRIGLGTKCGPDTLGKEQYRAARKHWIATDPECAAHDALQKAGDKARREARKAQAAAA